MEFNASVLPTQIGFGVTVAVIVGLVLTTTGPVTAVAWQLFASVTTTVYTPDAATVTEGIDGSEPATE